jgi:hypothetical protein
VLGNCVTGRAVGGLRRLRVGGPSATVTATAGRRRLVITGVCVAGSTVGVGGVASAVPAWRSASGHRSRRREAGVGVTGVDVGVSVGRRSVGRSSVWAKASASRWDDTVSGALT